MEFVKTGTALMAPILLLIVLSSCNRAGSTFPKEQNSANQNLDKVYNVPLSTLGESHKTVLTRFGACSLTGTEKIPNTHVSKQIDFIHTVTCDGIQARFYEPAANAREMLIFVRMTKNGFDSFPKFIGVHESELSARYGKPTKTAGNLLDYYPIGHETMADFITFELKDSRVISVNWQYYVD